MELPEVPYVAVILIPVKETETLGIDFPALPQDFVGEVKTLNLSPLGPYTNPIDPANYDDWPTLWPSSIIL